MQKWLNKHYKDKSAMKESFKTEFPDEHTAFKLMHKELHKAFHDFALGGDYCEHLDRLKVMIDDFLEIKEDSNIKTPLLTS